MKRESFELYDEEVELARVVESSLYGPPEYGWEPSLGEHGVDTSEWVWEAGEAELAGLAELAEEAELARLAELEAFGCAELECSVPWWRYALGGDESRVLVDMWLNGEDELCLELM